jgi:hypothetical protein
MTSVVGHLTGLDFDRQYKGWMSCPPGALFEAPVQETVDKVSNYPAAVLTLADIFTRTSYQLRITSGTKPSTPKPYLFGLIVIVKVSISALRSVIRPKQEMLGSKLSEPSSATRKARK